MLGVEPTGLASGCVLYIQEKIRGFRFGAQVESGGGADGARRNRRAAFKKGRPPDVSAKQCVCLHGYDRNHWWIVTDLGGGGCSC